MSHCTRPVMEMFAADAYHVFYQCLPRLHVIGGLSTPSYLGDNITLHASTLRWLCAMLLGLPNQDWYQI
jgi:hypothetical protein